MATETANNNVPATERVRFLPHRITSTEPTRNVEVDEPPVKCGRSRYRS